MMHEALHRGGAVRGNELRNLARIRLTLKV